MPGLLRLEGVGRQTDDRQTGGELGQGSGGLVTIQIGHLDVAQYKVEVVSAMQANVGQRFASVAGEVHGGPFLAQHLLQHHAVDGVVLGSEDAQAGQPLRVRGRSPTAHREAETAKAHRG